MSRDGDAAATMNQHRGELATSMGVTVLSADAQRVQAQMPVAGNRQPFGLLHGGASAVLAETVGSMHAAMVAPEGTVPVGIELSASHHRAAKQGVVLAECTPASVGRTLATFAIRITNEDGDLCCSARLTCLYRPA
jgi:uncharacterized protein (TIGR00369 family)